MKTHVFHSVIFLQLFTVFSEYFLIVSIVYILFVSVLITYNIYGLMIQKALSDCIALILFMACYLILNDDLLSSSFSIFNNSIKNDSLGIFTKFIVCYSAAMFFLINANFLKEQKLTSFEYLIILLFAVLGLLLMCNSNDLLTAYLTLELSSLAFYLLATFKKTSSYSIESGIKYFITGAVSSAFFLLGSSFIYGFSGSVNFNTFFNLFESYLVFYNFTYYYYYLHTSLFLPSADFFCLCRIRYWDLLSEQFIDHLHSYWLSDRYGFNFTDKLFEFSFVELGLSLILFSLFIKLALAPFHLWSLDVYEGSPTSSTFFFAVVSKLSIFALLIRLCYSNFFSFHSCWQFYSVWIGIFSVFVGSFGGLKQRKLKTLLAYSSTSHMGYALLAFSTSTYLGVQMLLFYLIIYIITGLAIWFILLFLRVKTKKNSKKFSKNLGDFALLKTSNSALAFLFTLTIFSIAGIPPMLGFLAKMNIFLSVVGISFNSIALFSILFSVVSTFYYIRIVKLMYFENLIVGRLYYSVNSNKLILLSILVILLIYFFLNPTLLYVISYKISLALM